MSKFKVGDKVKCIKDIMFFTNNHGKSHGVVSCAYDGGSFIKIDEHSISWNADMFEIADDWSIYNNDKPLSELTDEQVGKLVKHSGGVETFDGSFWYVVEPQWSVNTIYRAKQKSERELFIDAVNSALSNTALMTSLYAEMLFDSGKFELKAPKVGE